MIAVILPSRGLIFSKTIEELLRELKGRDYEIFFSHSKPIPDCFNHATEQALKSDCTHLWFVEEDMHLPEGILDELLSVDGSIVGADYKVGPETLSVAYKDNKVMYCGTGCLLVRREVFDNLNPYFRTDFVYSLPDYTPRKTNKETYGKHEVDFGIRVNNLGYEIQIIDTHAGQYRIKELGKEKTNHGSHEIVLLGE